MRLYREIAYLRRDSELSGVGGVAAVEGARERADLGGLVTGWKLVGDVCPIVVGHRHTSHLFYSLKGDIAGGGEADGSGTVTCGFDAGNVEYVVLVVVRVSGVVDVVTYGLSIVDCVFGARPNEVESDGFVREALAQ